MIDVMCRMLDDRWWMLDDGWWMLVVSRKSIDGGC